MEEKVDKKPEPVEKPNKLMAELRKEKRELKKARQMLHRSGCKGNAADKANSRRWFEVMREHSRLRRVLALRAETKVNSRELARFKRDPMKFGKQLFEKKLSGDPAFTSDAGFDYFSKLYAEPSRADPVSAMPEMKTVDPPSFLLSEAPPTAKEILNAIKSKSNGAAPGLDGLSYVPYKRCPCLLPVLVQLFAKIWSCKEIPSDWATACIQLLAKSEKTSDPAEFRPIALTNTVGKIFFGVIAKRLENFMLSNKYISHVQKGFKAETPGSLEHSFAMFEALLDAKHNQRQIVVAWLDLKNAYGSVRHNLIQFALSWFHVPLLIRQLILDYYDKICAQIRTKEWKTPFFVFDIGLFQGCVLSCILFNCVFQLLLNLVAPLSKKNGYNFKDSSVVLHDQAFADDISIMSSTPKLAQQSIDVLLRFLEWYRLQANPRKSITITMNSLTKETCKLTMSVTARPLLL